MSGVLLRSPQLAGEGGVAASSDMPGACRSSGTGARSEPWREASGGGGGPQPITLKFQVGAHTLWTARRHLRRVPLSLDAALAGRAPALPPLAPGEQGYLLTSAPTAALPEPPGFLRHVRQRYARYWIDLAAGEAAWWAGLSANARSQLKRKEKKLLGLGATIRRFRTPDEIAAFHPLARAVSARTYQERLLASGLPADPAPLLALAAADQVRAWLLELDGGAVAYLCCTADGATLRYDHLGHLPDAAAYAPGTVLQMSALRDLFAEGRWERFDFTEGEGQHKRQLASAGVECADLLLLRPTLANRALIAAMRTFDAAVTLLKRHAPALKRFRR